MVPIELTGTADLVLSMGTGDEDQTQNKVYELRGLVRGRSNILSDIGLTGKLRLGPGNIVTNTDAFKILSKKKNRIGFVDVDAMLWNRFLQECYAELPVGTYIYTNYYHSGSPQLTQMADYEDMNLRHVKGDIYQKIGEVEQATVERVLEEFSNIIIEQAPPLPEVPEVSPEVIAAFVASIETRV